MSKKVCKNKSGATLATAILEKSRGKLSEKANVNRDYEKIFNRSFTPNFIKYYELITSNPIRFGELTDEQFEELKNKLVLVTSKYCIDNLCQWFKVEKWQDLFPNDYKDVEELQFKKETYEVVVNFYEKHIVGDEDRDDRMWIKEYICKLMRLDYEKFYCKIDAKEVKEENIQKKGRQKEILTDEVKKQISEKSEIRSKNQLKEKLRKRREKAEEKIIEEIRLWIKENVYVNWETDPEVVELYDECRRCYNEKKDVNIDDEIEFRKWAKIRMDELKEKKCKISYDSYLKRL